MPEKGFHQGLCLNFLHKMILQIYPVLFPARGPGSLWRQALEMLRESGLLSEYDLQILPCKTIRIEQILRNCKSNDVLRADKIRIGEIEYYCPREDLLNELEETGYIFGETLCTEENGRGVHKDGVKITKYISVRVRNRALAAEAKQDNRKKNGGKLTCVYCLQKSEDFYDTSSDQGNFDGTFVAHHIVPVGGLPPSGTYNSLAGVEVLCPTCHSGIHKTTLSKEDFIKGRRKKCGTIDRY